MAVADLELSKRLERAEGHACRQFAKARRRLQPESGVDWAEMGGACAVFDGPESPITQAFGLGVFEPVSAEILGNIEDFFFSRGAHADLEVSPFAGVEGIGLLCARGYLPIEISSVTWQPLDGWEPRDPVSDFIRVRLAETPADLELWSSISARAWSHEHPELQEFLDEMGTLMAGREDTCCFIAEFDGVPAAAGALSIYDGVALFSGAATLPELRRRGLQSALLNARLSFASGSGCDLAMMVAALEVIRSGTRSGKVFELLTHARNGVWRIGRLPGAE